MSVRMYKTLPKLNTLNIPYNNNEYIVVNKDNLLIKLIYVSNKYIQVYDECRQKQQSSSLA